jgi:hypothetical protein
VPQGDELYDTRNAMRLCEGLDTEAVPLPVRERAGSAIFTDRTFRRKHRVRLRGGRQLRAYDYLHREYAGEDARVELKLRELEMAA